MADNKFGKNFLINFSGGVAWGLGATVGLAIVLAFFGFILGKINLVPIVGTFVADVIKFVLQNNPQLVK